jgi:hypothetical protein
MVIISINVAFLVGIFCLLQVFFDPKFTIGPQFKSKQHLHSRHVASYLVYDIESVMRVYCSREIGISETNHLTVGLVGETFTLGHPLSVLHA